MGGQSGQATVEWVGLVLVAALVLGALAALRAPAEERGLGAAVAKRITCAAGGACGAPAPARAAAPVGAPRVSPGGTPRVAAPPSVPRGATPGAAPRVSPAQAVNAFRRLRGLRTVGKRIWIVCLGYRRFRYELEHPLAPTEAVPLRDALEIANTCLNPLEFLGDG